MVLRRALSGPALFLPLAGAFGMLLVVLAAAGVAATGSSTTPSGLGPSPAVAASYAVTVVAQPNVTVSAATVVVEVFVKVNGVDAPNVTVTFTPVTGGVWSPISAVTGTTGQVNSSFTAPTVTVTTNYTLTATAKNTPSSVGPGTGSTRLVVRPSGPYLEVSPSFPQGKAVSSGASDLMVARVTNNTGSPVAGASVTVSSTAGSVIPIAPTTGASGNATFTFQAPTVVALSQAALLFVASAPGYTSGSSTDSLTLSPVTLTALYVAISPPSGNVAVGGNFTITVTVLAASASGSAVTGANVTLVLSDGRYSPGFVLTGVTGLANFTYWAPTSTSVSSVVVVASAVATGYSPGEAPASYSVGSSSSSSNPLPGLPASWQWPILAAVIVLVIVGIAAALLGRSRRKHRPPPVPAKIPPTASGGLPPPSS
jgi:hypothetical protein